jgi:hypothetical protein
MENEDKFFSRIEDTLHSYEDVYPDGAWEDFREKRKRRKALVLFFRLGSAAAVLLFLSYATIQFFNKGTLSTQITQTKISPKQKNNPNTIQLQQELNKTAKTVAENKANTQLNTPTIATQIVRENNKPKYQSNKVIPEVILVNPAVIQKPNVKVDDNSVIANVVAPGKAANVKSDNKVTDTAVPVNSATTTNITARNEVKKYTESTKSVYDSIMNSKVNKQVLAATAKKNEKNLSYGVVVSPALGNQKINFGTGVEVAYKINKNFFVSSGIAYSSLNATSGGGKLYAAAPGATGGTDVNLQVSGFEVPIGLQYRTDNGFYVSAGIVAMGVTNNKLEYNYIAQTTAAVMAPDAAGFTQNTIQVVNEKKTEDSKEKLNNYLGFYMMSIGKKKKIGNNQLTFGPFVRVPFGAVSSQKISLFQGGITLGFDF